MRMQHALFAALALSATASASAASAETAARHATATHFASETTLIEELGASMRALLRAVTPEIALPPLELRLPPLAR